MKLLKKLRDYLYPHRGNRYRAKILHPAAISVLVAFFLIYQFAINLTLLWQPSVLGYASNITPEKVIELTNQERAKNGLAPLKLNSVLSQAAQLKAGDMFAFNYWSHTSPSGRSPWDFFTQVGYQYLYAGENLARDFMNSDAVVAAWMNSSTHRDNILNNRYQEIGLAVVDGTLEGVETTLVVQLFGTPTPAPASTPETSLVEAKETEASLGQPSPAIQQVPLVVSPTATPTIIFTSPLTVRPPQEGMTAPTMITQADGEVSKSPMLSPFNLTRLISILLLGVILGVLALDVVWLYRKKIIRLSGKNIAHLIFIGAILLIIILLTPGAIL